MSDQFTCEVCWETFGKGWSDEEAKAELEATFNVSEDECGLVCDGCYKKMGFGS